MFFEKLRYRIFRYLIRKICKIPEGNLLPNYLVFVKFCFFPITYFVCKFYNNIYDFSKDQYTINGLKFGGGFFNIGIVGKKFEILQLDNGVITVKDIK